MRYCLVNATIITGKKGDAPFIGSIIINNGKIERILKGTCQDKIKKIDCTSKYIMPGLINAHVHLPGILLLIKLLKNYASLMQNLNLKVDVLLLELLVVWTIWILQLETV